MRVVPATRCNSQLLLMAKTDILSLSREQLTDTLVSHWGEARYRADQLYTWLWQKGIRDFEQMSNLPKGLRKKLEEHFHLQPLQVETTQQSKDGTFKIAFRLHDELLIESVLIPVPTEKRFTVCVSSQVGCSLNCSFCATGKMGLGRNLTAAEIFDQVFLVNQICEQQFGRKLTNVVYMGMGEPLLNYRPVLKSIERLTANDGLGLSPRRITLSTAGIAKAIRRLADENTRINLALSLHAADDEKRNRIMAINEHNDLQSLLEALRYFYQKTKNRISYEYIAFHRFNDAIEDAKKLVKLCRHFPVRINIIEYNPVQNVPFEASEEDRLEAFAKYLRDAGLTVTIRRSRGKDIDAACGQLATKAKQKTEQQLT